MEAWILIYQNCEACLQMNTNVISVDRCEVCVVLVREFPVDEQAE